MAAAAAIAAPRMDTGVRIATSNCEGTASPGGRGLTLDKWASLTQWALGADVAAMAVEGHPRHVGGDHFV